MYAHRIVNQFSQRNWCEIMKAKPLDSSNDSISSEQEVQGSSVLIEGMRNLRSHPILLFSLCAGIVISGSAAYGMEQQRALAIPLFGLFSAALVLWTLTEVIRVRSSKAPRSRAVTGSTRVGKLSSQKRVNITTGSVDGELGMQETGTGDVNIESMELSGGGSITTGDIKA